MKVYLIGMPGSGKTTLGKQLASALSCRFIDLDAVIEEREGKSIPDIFSQQGEDHFRQLESAALREWAGSKESFVMATGGGAPCFFKGIQVINDTGLSIFLDTPLQQLVERLASKSGRPLVESTTREELTNKLQRLREARSSFYEQARVIIQNPTIASLLEKIHFKK